STVIFRWICPIVAPASGPSSRRYRKMARSRSATSSLRWSDVIPASSGLLGVSADVFGWLGDDVLQRLLRRPSAFAQVRPHVRSRAPMISDPGADVDQAGVPHCLSDTGQHTGALAQLRQ